MALQCPVFDEGHRRIEGSLSTERWQNGIGLLPLEDFFNRLGSDRFDVSALGKLGIRHDRGGIRVHKNDIVSLLG